MLIKVPNGKFAGSISIVYAENDGFMSLVYEIREKFITKR